MRGTMLLVAVIGVLLGADSAPSERDSNTADLEAFRASISRQNADRDEREAQATRDAAREADRDAYWQRMTTPGPMEGNP